MCLRLCVCGRTGRRVRSATAGVPLGRTPLCRRCRLCRRTCGIATMTICQSSGLPVWRCLYRAVCPIVSVWVSVPIHCKDTTIFRIMQILTTFFRIFLYFATKNEYRLRSIGATLSVAYIVGRGLHRNSLRVAGLSRVGRVSRDYPPTGARASAFALRSVATVSVALKLWLCSSLMKRSPFCVHTM